VVSNACDERRGSKARCHVSNQNRDVQGAGGAERLEKHGDVGQHEDGCGDRGAAEWH